MSILAHHNVFLKSVNLLSGQQSMRIIFNTLEGNYALCLLANLLQLAYNERDGTLRELCYPSFVVCITGRSKITESLGNNALEIVFVQKFAGLINANNKRKYHPISCLFN